MKPTAKIIMISALWAFCSACLANELLVPSQYSTIQSAVDAAVNSDTVIVSPGTYTGPGNRDIDFLGKAITVQSTDPNDPNIVAATIIDCNSTEAEPHTGFYFQQNDDANSILSGFKITNGESGVWSTGSSTIKNCLITGNSGYYGGGIVGCPDSPNIINCTISDNIGCGIVFDGGSPKIINCIIRDNDGVGIYTGSLTITNCIISDNNGIGIESGGNSTITNCTINNNKGSGIHVSWGSPTITSCTITGNSAYVGGGICCEEADNPIITNCNITGNLAEAGGGIYGCGGPVTNCTITGNSAIQGGGLSCCHGNSIIANCTITGNSAYDSGGGIDSVVDGQIVHCTIAGNSAGYDGGGLFFVDVPITNCIIANNSASGSGGGLYHGGGPITNCTVANNSAGGSGGGLFDFGELITNCIIWGNWPDQLLFTWPVTITYSNIQGGYPGLGNIDADPYFVDADANDYHLKSEGWSWDVVRKRWTYDDVTSRCIDAGNPGSPLGDELLSIPDDPNNVWGQNLRIDMGAFGGTAEASIPPYDWVLLADITNDGLADLTDFAFQALEWLNSADQQPGDLNRDSLVDASDLALLIEDWLGQTSWHE